MSPVGLANTRISTGDAQNSLITALNTTFQCTDESCRCLMSWVLFLNGNERYRGFLEIVLPLGLSLGRTGG